MPKRWLCIFVLLLFCAAAFARQRQPDADYKTRREALGKKVGGIVVLFGSLEPVESLYSFRQDDDFYYLSGWTEPGAALLMAPAVEAGDKNPATPYTEILFLPPRNLRMERFTGPKLGADDPQAAKLTGFNRVEEISQLPQELSKVMPRGQPIVYTELPEPGETSPISQPLEFLKRTDTFLTFQDVKPSIAAIRLHKDAAEISLLQKAVDISILAHTAAMKAVKPNLPEYQISALLQYEWERRGCERAAYPSIVGSGHNSTVLHYSENTSTMKPGDVVVIDAAAECSMYAADITRTLPIGGHFTARQREIYNIVLGAQQAAIDAFQSGKSLLYGDSEASLTRVAKDYIRAHGKDLHGQPLDQYFIHGIGHYIGLDVHDVGDYKLPLAPGMTFTIEPGIYIPEENLGVRIEDDFLVGEDGKLIKLSATLPSKAEDVEKIMAGK
ncbi:MAG TPA: aminopeptidase P N-terminal domain-containing protein [Candidatus Sulfotelmatobacter sp.]